METVPNKGENKRRRTYGLCCVVLVQFPPAFQPLNLSRWWARSLDQAGRPCQKPPMSQDAQEEEIQVLRFRWGPCAPGDCQQFCEGTWQEEQSLSSGDSCWLLAMQPASENKHSRQAGHTP